MKIRKKSKSRYRYLKLIAIRLKTAKALFKFDSQVFPYQYKIDRPLAKKYRPNFVGPPIIIGFA